MLFVLYFGFWRVYSEMYTKAYHSSSIFLSNIFVEKCWQRKVAISSFLKKILVMSLCWRWLAALLVCFNLFFSNNCKCEQLSNLTSTWAERDWSRPDSDLHSSSENCRRWHRPDRRTLGSPGRRWMLWPSAPGIWPSSGCRSGQSTGWGRMPGWNSLNTPSPRQCTALAGLPCTER